MKKKIINTENAPAPIGPYNQAVQIGNLLYISGQIPMDAKTGELIIDDIRLATEKVMQNLEAILKAADSGFDQVIKSSIFLMDMANFPEMNEVYGKYFEQENAPARECVQVSGLPKGVRVEISMIALGPTAL